MKKGIKNSRNSIRRKVARRVVYALLVTIFVLSTVNMIYTCRRVIKEQHKELDLANELCASQIDAWAGKMDSITKDVACSLAALEILDEVNVEKVLDSIIANNDDLFNLYVGTEDGKMFMAKGVSFPTGMDPRVRPWYEKAKEAGETVVIDPYPSATRPDLMHMTIATPIFIDDKLVGVVGADAEIGTINDYINSIDFENGAYGFLLDSEGDIVAHPNKDYKPTVNSVVNVKDVMPKVAKLIETGSDETVVAEDYNGTRMVYSVEQLSTGGWTLGVAYPERNVAKIIDRGIRISLVMALICIFFAAADITVAIKKILLPIERINPAMDKLMQGDLSARIDISSEKDELGDLQNRMADLVNYVSSMIEKQKNILAEMEKGNLAVVDVEEYPGDLKELSNAINSIKSTFNDIISDIQFSAINLQSYAMGINETSDLEEMKAVFEELSAEANALMAKTSRFTTIPPECLDKM